MITHNLQFNYVSKTSFDKRFFSFIMYIESDVTKALLLYCSTCTWKEKKSILHINIENPIA